MPMSLLQGCPHLQIPQWDSCTYGERELPTTEVGWTGEGTFAVFRGKMKGGTGIRGREGGREPMLQLVAWQLIEALAYN